jgi:hypothetical protein
MQGSELRLLKHQALVDSREAELQDRDKAMQDLQRVGGWVLGGGAC